MRKRYQNYFNSSKYIGESAFESSPYEIQEAVIHPGNYLKNIEKKLDKYLTKIVNKNYDLNSLCKRLGFYFAQYKIKFVAENGIEKSFENFIKYGINKGETDFDKFATIYIYCNANFLNIQKGDKDFNIFFKKWFLFVLSHELIHRGQSFRIRDIDLKAKVMSSEYKNIKNYLSDKHEIMARAWEIVEFYKIVYNFDNLKILNIIKDTKKTFKSNVLEVYLSLFSKDSKTLKLLYKYMYEYLTDDS